MKRVRILPATTARANTLPDVPAELELRLAARCPHCGKPPRKRITAGERALALAQAPTEPKESVQCHHCNQFYTITAGAYHEAA